MSLRSIALTALVLGIVWYWLKARELKERAVRLADRHCESLSLSLLDQTVVLKKLRLVKENNGRYSVYREYQFDFSSTGEDRYKGLVRLLGGRLEGVTLAPHRVD